ncbi:hypothetical protein ETAA8_23570 [Anatilimnocola aggregata]|uniref:Uncharacterized protein n=1 Tax=Anatilimnocola aggregata TaxID=2528021 RepID=A0A517YAK9_9BACT|nr:hypothetical protein [Anatilimnocola aggregata]QDU27270.1 hypothetical protein ETAA8_23570 [Anatilimnocola aggregata]
MRTVVVEPSLAHTLVMNKLATPPAQEPARPAASQLAGKVVVIGVLVIAVALASFALWWNVNRAKRSLEFWQADAVRIIQHGKRVELLTLRQVAGASTAEDAFALGGQQIEVVSTLDISQAKGLIHARHALTDDSSFVWNNEKSPANPQWIYAIRFADDKGEVLLALDLKNQRLANVHGGREVTVIPKIAEGWQIFIDKQLKRQE